MSISRIVRSRFIGWNNGTYIRNMKLFYNARKVEERSPFLSVFIRWSYIMKSMHSIGGCCGPWTIQLVFHFKTNIE
jgi:hypothetical protein